MTIKKIIDRVDKMKPNAVEEEQKLIWIAELDGSIALKVMLMHPSEISQFAYSYPEALEQTPLVQFPHDAIYEKWLIAQIDAVNEEWEQYTNAMEVYNACFNNFVNWFVAAWRPAQGPLCCNDGHYPAYFLTAYGLAVQQGFEGTVTEWLESLIGPKGDPFRYEDFTAEQLLELNADVFIVSIRSASHVAWTADKTYKEIKAAYDADKMVLLKAERQIYAASNSEAGSIRFGYSLTAPVGKLYRYAVSPDDTWSRVEMAVPYSTTEITKDSNHTTMPTALAVHNYVAAAVKPKVEVFIAEYGVTTHAEVKEADNDGKAVIVSYGPDGKKFPLIMRNSDPSGHAFGGYMDGKLYALRLSLRDAWSASVINIADAISENTADEQHIPTAQAVQSFVTKMIADTLSGGELGALVPATRTVNGKALSEDISLSADDVGASAKGHIHTDYVPVARSVNGKYLNQNINLSASDVGAAPSGHSHSDYVPTSRTVNGKALSGNITLSASDVGAATSGHNHDGSYFKRYDLNAINVDSTDGNWTVDISEGGHGTVPEVWVNVQQFTSGHFRTQVARKCDTSTDATRKGTRTWTRNKYTGGVWSVWEKIYTESDCATNGIAVKSATVSGDLTVSGTSKMGRIDASNEYLTGSLYVGGKSSTSDGKTGVAFGASGNVTMQGSSQPTLNLHLGNSTTPRSKIFVNASTLSFQYNGGTATDYGFNLSTVALYPNSAANGAMTIGTSDRKWGTIYSVSSAISTSDRNLKTDIQPIDERYVSLFDKLEPVSYKLIGDNHDRDHLGFISQDIWAAMQEIGLSDLEFGGFCRDQKHETVVVDKIKIINDKGEEEEIEVTAEQPVFDENGEPVYSYSLRYGEFIALNSKMIQLCRKTIREQQAEIERLTDRISQLEEKLNTLFKEE